jgi:hypothetical protein
MGTTWKTTKVDGGWVYEKLDGDPGWGGFRVTPPPGTPPPPVARGHAPTPHTTPRPMVMPAGCIPTCPRTGWHEQWGCEFLATTDEEWGKLLT